MGTRQTEIQTSSSMDWLPLFRYLLAPNHLGTLIRSCWLSNKFFDTFPPGYAILSHTWEKEEVLFSNMTDLGKGRCETRSPRQRSCRFRGYPPMRNRASPWDLSNLAAASASRTPRVLPSNSIPRRCLADFFLHLSVPFGRGHAKQYNHQSARPRNGQVPFCACGWPSKANSYRSRPTP